MSATSAKWMYVKAAMFVLIGATCAASLIVQTPTSRTVALVAVGIWAFCRAYYFAFYVIEKYVDPGFRFSGLWAFVRYLTMRKELRIEAIKTTSDPNRSRKLM